MAAAYVTLTLLFAPISFGPIQVRIAEALTILPMFTPAAVPGLFIGCLRGNLHVKALIWGVLFSSFATLIGA
ncbi:MAG: QueT transporter family protein [Pyramidobacter sp.]|nr:QueT transporter family protein [Pyramidobacter sp.]